MEPLSVYIQEYKKQLEHGMIQKAYRGLMEYMSSLRAHLQEQYPGYSVPGNMYFGYMDMTYFSFTSPGLKGRGLKVAIVLVHDGLRFEAWLAGANKQVQAKTWELLKQSGWTQYPLVPDPKQVDAIVETVLVAEPDFTDLGRLTSTIERHAVRFINAIETFLEEMPGNSKR